MHISLSQHVLDGRNPVVVSVAKFAPDTTENPSHACGVRVVLAPYVFLLSMRLVEYRALNVEFGQRKCHGLDMILASPKTSKRW